MIAIPIMNRITALNVLSTDFGAKTLRNLGQ